MKIKKKVEKTIQQSNYFYVTDNVRKSSGCSSHSNTHINTLTQIMSPKT